DLNLGASDATSSFTFSEPALLGRDLKFTFSGLYAQTEANYASWDSRLVQGGIALEFPLSQTARLETRYTLNKSRIFNVSTGGTDADGNPILASSPILQREELRGSLWGSAVGYTLSLDNRRGGLAG